MTFVITGGSSGIGRGAALQLAMLKEEQLASVSGPVSQDAGR